MGYYSEPYGIIAWICYPCKRYLKNQACRKHYPGNFFPMTGEVRFCLLVFVCVISSFLDNIAAALIGGAIAIVVFKNRVHIGYIAAIVAASNAGGSGSVVGDTTTTMMWIDGVSPLNVLHGFVAALTALIFFAWFASHQQDKYQRIQKRAWINC